MGWFSWKGFRRSKKENTCRPRRCWHRNYQIRYWCYKQHYQPNAGQQGQTGQQGQGQLHGQGQQGQQGQHGQYDKDVNSKKVRVFVDK